MKLKSLFLTLLVMFAGVATAQVESSKVYRIVSSKYRTVITASPITNKLSCVSAGSETDYQQMWEFTLDETTGKYCIQNVFSRRYIQREGGQNVVFVTGNEKVYFAVMPNEKFPNHYEIDASNKAGGWGLHCDGSSNVVPWSYGPDKDGNVSGTEWFFEEVSIDQAAKDKAYNDYIAYNSVLENKASIIEKVTALFEDKAGTELKAEYVSMSDEEILVALEGVPADLQQAVLKVKNNSWTTEARENLSEKNFRIYDYKPYSNPEHWKDILYHRPFNRINNPTGICSESDKGYIYVFVDAVPAGTEIYLAEMNGTAYFGTDTKLVEGLNIVPSALKDGVLYIRYVCDTHTGFNPETKSGPKKLSDYPNVKIHIEGGYVNGFWSKERGHTNEDWVYMGQNMFRNEAAVQAVGDHSMLNFRKKEFLQPSKGYDAWGYLDQGCPSQIEEVMKFWDFWNERQRHYMALDKYYDYFNNKQLAMSDDNGFMDAGNYRTHYNNNTLTTIVNIDRITRDGGSAWGPLHEIGHTNQYAFQIVGTSEVSNNALTNFAIFDQGTHVSRGNNMENQILDFENKIPYVVRGEGMYGSKLFSMTRMYFQLFLYFHAAGKDTTFYPRLFEKLRYDQLPGWRVGSSDVLDENGFYRNSVNAAQDQLKFAEACCEIAQMDLSEFFEAWGFFIPMKNAFVGDYGHHWVYLLEEDAKASKARMQKYEKKGGHLMFLEDRVRQSPRKKSPFSDGTGYRANYADWDGETIGTVGKFGQWMDYIDESVKAQGYYYAVSNKKVLIKEAAGASGALGFKLYNAETGELLSYTNKLEMNIPVTAAGATFKVVAAQADGTDYVVPHASEGPESMQKEALEGSLVSAKAIIDKVAKQTTVVGYYYPEAVAELQSLYNEANAAYKANDTSKYSFAEWSMMLDDERNRVVNNIDSRILIKEGAVFTMRRLLNPYRGYYAVGEYPTASTTNKSSGDINWILEYAGKVGEYYLKSESTGYYLTNLTTAGAFLETKKQSDAKAFTVGYTDDGGVNFILVENEGQTLGLSDAGNVTLLPLNETGSKWRVDIVEDNSLAFYKDAIEDLMVEANLKITEVLNLDSLQTMNIFNKDIIVTDNNLNTYALNLLDTYYEVSKNMEGATVTQLQKYTETLRKQLAEMEGKYIVAAPITTKGDKIVWYYLISNKSEKLASIYSGTVAARKTRVEMSSTVSDDALWSFASTGKAGEYKLYNAGQQGFAYRQGTKNYIFTSAEEDYLPVNIAYDSEKGGLLLTAADKVVYDGGTAVQIGSTKTYWRVQIALIENNKEVADIITTIESVIPEANANGAIYDLSGRRVVNPERGIFIQGGKKVLVK